MSFGIDFGTTNTAVVFGEEELIGGETLPSAVALNKNSPDKILYSTEVREKHLELLDAGNWHVITSIKSILDKEDQEWTVNGIVETPQSIVTYFFEHLLDFVQDNHGQAMTDAVVSIPVGFGAKKRRILRQAAKDAGLTITDFVSESTAAVMKMKAVTAGMTNVAVFDWGGGTLDVSILKLTGGLVNELAIDSLPLAGDRIDQLIAEWAYEQFKPNLNDPPPDLAQVPPHDRDALLVESEVAKRQLSIENETLLTIKSFLGAKYPDVVLDRERLRILTGPLLGQAFAVLSRALEKAGLDGKSIDGILPVGGTCNLVAVWDELNEAYPGKVYRSDNPEWLVAQGASKLASQIDERRKSDGGEAGGVAKLNQTIALRLADDSVMAFASPNDRFGAAPRTHHLGIIEDCTSAQLIFVESIDQQLPEDRMIGCLSIPMQGFYQERLTIETHLTPDLTFVARAKSYCGNDADRKEFEYERLRFVYDLR